MARAISTPDDASPPRPTSPIDPMISRRRAVVEMLLLIPAAGVGLIAGLLVIIALDIPDSRWQTLGSNIGMGIAIALAAGVMTLLKRRPLSTLGWTTRDLGVNVVIGIAATILVQTALVMLSFLLLPWHEGLNEPSEAQKAIETHIPPLSVFGIILMNVTVVIYEETVFRGFLLTRCQVLFRRWWITVPVVAVLFGVIHAYEGAIAVAFITFLALVMGTLFVWRKSLVPAIIVHLAQNISMMLLIKSVSTTWQ